jgi:hypothetical protein
MNFVAAAARPGPPQEAIRKYIGMSTTSKKTKNRMRSSAAKVPSTPTSSNRVSARNCRGRSVCSAPARV